MDYLHDCRLVGIKFVLRTNFIGANFGAIGANFGAIGVTLFGINDTILIGSRVFPILRDEENGRRSTMAPLFNWNISPV